ncbi:MAG TPA: hypothetical protein VHU61_10425 [Solirubrobacteraceae bacterium]|nr:hypothetical protein [Solirubrobacteraceae bacterium]
MAAFAVHQLRFLLAFGSGAGAELKETGHSYLHSVVPWIMLLVGLSVGAFLWSLGQAAAGKRSESRRGQSFIALWLACASCLLAIYCTQEFLEGLFATGHPTGLAGIFGFGGLWSIPSAAGVGLVLASLMYGASWTLARVSLSCKSLPRARPRRVPLVLCPRAIVRRPVEPLVRGWCDRGPPVPHSASA